MKNGASQWAHQSPGKRSWVSFMAASSSLGLPCANLCRTSNKMPVNHAAASAHQRTRLGPDRERSIPHGSTPATLAATPLAALMGAGT